MERKNFILIKMIALYEPLRVILNPALVTFVEFYSKQKKAWGKVPSGFVLEITQLWT